MSGTKSRTILLVDDDEDFVYQQKVQLEALGYRVVTADSKTAAERALSSARPDLAVVDLMMEDMDAGFSVCHNIKKKDKSIPVIMCTGVVSETGLEFDAVTGEERAWVKADVLLSKPVRFEQLKREIDRLLAD
ncbi:MAG: response regulator [Candidatus Hydrogenedentes bacterium]|nr:response regulator [Candidatus Hydrogenedentota bacterium]